MERGDVKQTNIDKESLDDGMPIASFFVVGRTRTEKSE